MCAPIVLFVYNRPEHTHRTIDALRKNPLALQSHLYIYSDGPKNEAAFESVKKVREICAQVTGFASTTLITSERNRGLAASIIEGVTAVVGEHGRVIVLEDDLVTAPQFLEFMNAALDRYAHVDQVMHISGATYPISTQDLPSTFFLQIPLCWGWATWDRAWAHFKKDLAVMDAFSPAMRHHFNFNGSHDYWAQLERNKAGAINTWFIFWYAALALKNGLALFSRESLVRNIGFDGSGVHCGTSQAYTAEASGRLPTLLAGDAPTENRLAYKRHVQFFNLVGHSRRRRWLERMRRAIVAPLGLP